MRFLKRLVKLGAVGVIACSVAWSFLVFSTAKILGNAVLFAENDAYVMIALDALTIPTLMVITAALWRAGRARKRTELMSQAPFPPQAPPIAVPNYQSAWGTQPPPSP